MSGSRLVRNSPDLVRLVQDGYAVRIVSGFLVVDDIPFVDATAQVHRGSLICPLDLSGTTAIAPSTHVMCFVGGVPCDKNGQAIAGLVNDGVEKWSAAPELTAACGFSQKPDGGYPDFYEKVTYYAAMIIGPAQAVDPHATPHTYRPVQTDEDDGVFLYVDTFSSRADITDLNTLLALEKVIIVGLGGTGAERPSERASTPGGTPPFTRHISARFLRARFQRSQRLFARTADEEHGANARGALSHDPRWPLSSTLCAP